MEHGMVVWKTPVNEDAKGIQTGDRATGRYIAETQFPIIHGMGRVNRKMGGDILCGRTIVGDVCLESIIGMASPFSFFADQDIVVDDKILGRGGSSIDQEREEGKKAYPAKKCLVHWTPHSVIEMGVSCVLRFQEFILFLRAWSVSRPEPKKRIVKGKGIAVV